MIPATEGQHAICWFIHDPATLFSEATKLRVPQHWVHAALTGLQCVNPYIKELDNLRQCSDDDEFEMALHLQQPHQVASDEIAAVISLAPACPPSSRTIVIKRKNNFMHCLLPISSPYVVFRGQVRVTAKNRNLTELDCS
jgi:hypothetical protein